MSRKMARLHVILAVVVAVAALAPLALAADKEVTSLHIGVKVRNTKLDQPRDDLGRREGAGGVG